jgi:hypothetical protein
LREELVEGWKEGGRGGDGGVAPGAAVEVDEPDPIRCLDMRWDIEFVGLEDVVFGIGVVGQEVGG